MEKKRWYQSSLIAVILLILFFPVGIYLMWRYTNWNVIIKGIITFIFALLVFVSITSPKSKTENVSTIITPQVKQDVTTVPIPTTETKPLTITDKLWIALDNSIKSRNGYNIEYDESSKTASLTKTSPDFLDANSLVRDDFTTLVKYGTETFKIEGVDAVRIVTKTDFTDQYGKKSTEDAVRIIMSKSEFIKFDWNNLKYQSVYNQIKNASDGFYIQPDILSKLDFDKLYLSL